MEKCIACGLCAEKCPAKTADEYEEGLGKRKAIYVPYPQAVPLKYVIDQDRCIYFKKGKCRACEKYCPTGAILFDEQEKHLELNVGSVILTPGLQTFDPGRFDTYQYSTFKNVVTSIEFERILSAGGPTQGRVVRPSDGQPAKRIAWLQCIGSREINRCDNGYCSAVCCMYAIKEAVMAKEHVGQDCQPSIFYIDLRTSGKDFEKYYYKAEAEGVRFVRSRVHSITRKDPSGTLELQYVTEDGRNQREEFDLVVLSVGMEPAKSAVETAAMMGIELNEYSFVQTSDFTPVTTNRAGIYVAGVAKECKDIPQSVMEASAAAGSAGIDLAEARGTLVSEKSFGPEKDFSGQEVRIGVFVCNCGTNIGGVADVPSIVEFARTLPGVVYAEENQFSCSQDTQANIAQTVRENDLNRVVVAACTPRTHEPLFQETIRDSGLNPYLFEMANIRNQCTWCHSGDKEKATAKSKDLVKMAVAKAALLEAIPEMSVDITKSVLVIGGGLSGMTAALNLGDQGFTVYLLERDPELGGVAGDISHTWSGGEVQPYLRDLRERVQGHSGITTLLGAEVVDSSGFVGNFRTTVKQADQTRTLEHGATIFATGGKATDTEEYLFGQNPNVTRWHEIEQDKEKLDKAKSLVFIQCVGSRDENRPYCSRICCTTSITQAIRIKEASPEKNVYILYRDIRTPGAKEKLYKKARQLGVVFIRYSLDNKPLVSQNEDGLLVRVFDPILQQDIEIKTDLINLATAIEPNNNQELSRLFKLPLNEENFFMEAHAKLRPVDFASDGLFLCGLAHYPKPIEESLAQASAAAGRAATVLSKSKAKISPLISQIDQDKCIGCGLCIDICPFAAIQAEEVEENIYRAVNIPASCKGCGLCASSCPQRAIDMLHFRDSQLEAVIQAAV
ncbi:MAG: FAD-dependent oxidoreductase [Desulfohalobiaceae bacterium]|nr:FAD-dependent oxidoreductase [Desulfohalobiaceae bacterium]